MQFTPLKHLALVPGDFVFLGPTELKQLKRQLLAVTISGPDSRLKHTSNLPVEKKKKAY